MDGGQRKRWIGIFLGVGAVGVVGGATKMFLRGTLFGGILAVSVGILCLTRAGWHIYKLGCPSCPLTMTVVLRSGLSADSRIGGFNIYTAMPADHRPRLLAD